MSHFQGPEKEILFQQNHLSEENFENNREITIIAPILPFQNQDISQKNINQKKQETITVQVVTTGQNQAAKQGTQMRQKIRPFGKNLLTLQKKYRQLIDINPTFNENTKNNDADFIPSDRLENKQAKFKTILPAKQFHRTDLRNHRKSLHVIMRQNDDNEDNGFRNNNEDTLLTRQSKKIISQQYTQRRKPEQGVNGLQWSQIELLREGKKQTTIKTFMNSKSNNANNFIKTNSHKRYQWQSVTRLDDQIYNYPEKNSQRVIVFIKTYIISQFQSVCIQVSLLKGSLIIVGNLFGEEKQTIKMVVNEEKTEKLFNQSFRDWEVLGRRVYVEMGLSGGRRIRIGPVKQRGDSNAVVENINNETSSNTSNNNTSSTYQRSRSYMKRMTQIRKKQTLLRQKQFIRRNYYSIITKGANTETIATVQYESNHNTINYAQRKRFSSIDHKEVGVGKQLADGGSGDYSRLRTPYFINRKHINYLSPQIKQKVKLISKHKFVDKDQIQAQKFKKQAFLKKQQLFTQRISQSKDKKQHSQRYNNNKLNKEKTKSKGRLFAVLKVGSLKSIGHDSFQNEKQINIQFNNLEKKVDEQNCKISQNDDLNCIQQQQIITIEENKEKQQSSLDDQTSRVLEIKIIESSRGSFEQEDDKSKISCQDLKQNSQPQIEDNKGFDISFVQKVECDKEESDFSEQEDKLESRIGQGSGEYDNQFEEDEQQPKQKSVPNNNSQITPTKKDKLIQDESRQQIKAQNSQYSDFIREIEDDEYEISYQNIEQEEKRCGGVQQMNKEKEHKVQQQYEQSFDRELEGHGDDEYNVQVYQNDVCEEKVGQCDEAIQ